jgi:gluconokinase
LHWPAWFERKHLSLLLAVDIGTGSCRGVLYDPELNRVGAAAVEYATQYPRPGWAEQDPETVFDAVLQAVSDAVAASRFHPAEVTALTLDGPLHTCLGLTAEGVPATPVLTWEDSRAHRITHHLQQAAAGSEIYKQTGCPLHPLYPSAKIAWWRTHRPDRYAGIDRFVSLKAYVLFRLTGELLEDQATASGSGLLNISTLDWDAGALEQTGVTREQLPPLVAPTHVVSRLDRSISARTGLPASIPVVVGSSDAAMSSLGSGTIDLDQMTVMVGTSGAVRRLVKAPLLDPQQRTFCYYFADRLWFAGGAINNGGIVLRWFRDHFGRPARKETAKTEVSAYADLCDAAVDIPPGSDGLFFLPFLAGERSPHWGSNMRASLIGLTLHHRQPHVIRALLEGVCYRIHSVAQPLEDLVGESREVRATGGFARSTVWLQILADVMGRELLALREPEGSVLGAAALALRTLGAIDSYGCLRDKNPVQRTIQPRPEAHRFYTTAYQRYLQLYWKLRPEF